MPASSASTRSWTEAESVAAFEALGDRVIDAIRRWDRSGRRWAILRDLYTVAGTELSLTQVDILEALRDQQRPMNDLARLVGVDPSTATRAAAPLVDLGLLTRSTDPNNRRYVLVSCTTKGRRVTRSIVDRRRQQMHSVLEPMAPERRLLLADLLEEFVGLVDESRP